MFPDVERCPVELWLDVWLFGLVGFDYPWVLGCVPIVGMASAYFDWP